MAYLVNNEYTPPIVSKGEVITPYIIAVICIIFFLAFVLWMVWLIGGGSSTGKGAVADQLLLACSPGECTVTMSNGSKRCPIINTDVVLADPSSEVCSAKFSCTSPFNPYALLSDGSTNSLGVCETNTICRCLKT